MSERLSRESLSIYQLCSAIAKRQRKPPRWRGGGCEAAGGVGVFDAAVPPRCSRGPSAPTPPAGFAVDRPAGGAVFLPSEKSC